MKLRHLWFLILAFDCALPQCFPCCTPWYSFHKLQTVKGSLTFLSYHEASMMAWEGPKTWEPTCTDVTFMFRIIDIFTFHNVYTHMHIWNSHHCSFYWFELILKIIMISWYIMIIMNTVHRLRWHSNEMASTPLLFPSLVSQHFGPNRRTRVRRWRNSHPLEGTRVHHIRAQRRQAARKEDIRKVDSLWIMFASKSRTSS